MGSTARPTRSSSRPGSTSPTRRSRTASRAEGAPPPAARIIFATGSHVPAPPIADRIQGRGGRALAEVWAGSPRTHLGMSVAGFPNLFFLLGPNTGLGHNSVLLMIEAQIAYLRRLLGHRASTGAAAVEPTPQAQ